MDSHDSGANISSDEELVDQLRQYVDALAARTSRRPVVVAENQPEPRLRRHASVLAVAAAAVLLIGSAVWMGLGGESNSIASTSDQQTTTTETDAPDDSAGAGSWLMPDPAVWVITETYPQQTSMGRALSGVWAWRLAGKVYLLLDGVGLEDLGPLEKASIDRGDGRVMIGWVDGDHRLGLQGYGVDETELRSVAAAIAETDSGWTLPEAEVLVADGASESGVSESIQVGYSPLKPDGTPDLSTVVTGNRRRGTEADMFRELFEASGIGQVTETTVAGQSGFLVIGAFASYGLAFGDGWVSSWSSTNTGIDLTAMMESVQVVDDDQWDSAVAGVDQVVSEAIEATIVDLDTADPADDPNLPRYVLPEPWTMTLVTDMGLWSAEERAQREALNAANAPPGGFAELIWTQGFAVSDPAGVRASSLPFAVPDAVVQVYRRETDEPLNPEPGEGEPLFFAGLDGYLERREVFDPAADSQSTTEFKIFAAKGSLLLNIEAPFSTEDEIRRFAQSLSISEDDLARGLDSSADNIQLLLELPGDSGNGSNFYSRWLAGYTTDSTEGGSGQPEASLRVESMSFEQVQLETMRARSRGLDYEPVAGTGYLAAQYEQPKSPVFDDDDHPISRDQPDMVVRTSLLRYDPQERIMVTLNLAGDLTATIALMEQLTETDLDTWRKLVEPYNAKPLQPR